MAARRGAEAEGGAPARVRRALEASLARQKKRPRRAFEEVLRALNDAVDAGKEGDAADAGGWAEAARVASSALFRAGVVEGVHAACREDMARVDGAAASTSGAAEPEQEQEQEPEPKRGRKRKQPARDGEGFSAETYQRQLLSWVDRAVDRIGGAGEGCAAEMLPHLVRELVTAHSGRRPGEGGGIPDADADRALLFARRVMRPMLRRAIRDAGSGDRGCWGGLARTVSILADVWAAVSGAADLAPRLQRMLEEDQSFGLEAASQAGMACSLSPDQVRAVPAACRLLVALATVDEACVHSRLDACLRAALVALSAEEGPAAARGCDLAVLVMRIASGTRQLEALISRAVALIAEEGDGILPAPGPAATALPMCVRASLRTLVSAQARSRAPDIVGLAHACLDRLVAASAGGRREAALFVCGDLLGLILDAVAVDATNASPVLRGARGILVSHGAAGSLRAAASGGDAGLAYARLCVLQPSMSLVRECGRLLQMVDGEDREAGGVRRDPGAGDDPSGEAVGCAELEACIAAAVDTIRRLAASGGDDAVLVRTRALLCELCVVAINSALHARSRIISQSYATDGESADAAERDATRAGARALVSRVVDAAAVLAGPPRNGIDFRAAVVWHSVTANFAPLSLFMSDASLQELCLALVSSMSASRDDCESPAEDPSVTSSLCTSSRALLADPAFYDDERTRVALPMAINRTLSVRCSEFLARVAADSGQGTGPPADGPVVGADDLHALDRCLRSFAAAPAGEAAADAGAPAEADDGPDDRMLHRCLGVLAFMRETPDGHMSPAWVHRTARTLVSMAGAVAAAVDLDHRSSVRRTLALLNGISMSVAAVLSSAGVAMCADMPQGGAVTTSLAWAHRLSTLLLALHSACADGSSVAWDARDNAANLISSMLRYVYGRGVCRSSKEIIAFVEGAAREMESGGTPGASGVAAVRGFLQVLSPEAAGSQKRIWAFCDRTSGRFVDILRSPSADRMGTHSVDEIFRCLSVTASLCRAHATAARAAGSPPADRASAIGERVCSADMLSWPCRAALAAVSGPPQSTVSQVSIVGALELIVSALGLSAATGVRFGGGEEGSDGGADERIHVRLTLLFVHLQQRRDRMGPPLVAALTRATRRYISLMSLQGTYRLYQLLKRVIAASSTVEGGHGLGAVRVLALAIESHRHHRDKAQLLSLGVRDVAAGVVTLWSGSVARGSPRGTRLGAPSRECLDVVVRVCQSVNLFTMTAFDVADAMQATTVALSGGTDGIADDVGRLRAAASCCEVHKALLLSRGQQAKRCLGLLTAFSRACVGLLTASRRAGADAEGAAVGVARAMASLFSALSAHSTTVTLYATHMVADVVSATTAAAVDRNVVLPHRVSSCLNPGVYALMDLLSAREMQMLYATLGVGRLGKQRQHALRNLKTEYEREHKYSGKV